MGAEVAVAAGLGLISAFQANKANKAQSAIADQQLYEAKFYRDIWDRYYRECELSHTEDICARKKITLRYATTRNRLMVENRRAFAAARQKAFDCMPIMCSGAAKAQLTQLAIAEAQSEVEVANRAFRYEETRKERLDALLDDLKYRQYQLGRGMIVSATNAAQLAAGQFGQMASGSGQLAGYALSKALRGIGGGTGNATPTTTAMTATNPSTTALLQLGNQGTATQMNTLGAVDNDTYYNTPGAYDNATTSSASTSGSGSLADSF